MRTTVFAVGNTPRHRGFDRGPVRAGRPAWKWCGGRPIAAWTCSSAGEPFTSYIWPTTLKKPVLFPDARGEGRVGDARVSARAACGGARRPSASCRLWFNYGDVNGVDFWNNSDAIPAARRSRNGTILHRGALGCEEGATGEGELEDDRRVGDPGRRACGSREDTPYAFRGHSVLVPSSASSPSPRSTSACRSPTTRRGCSGCASRGAREAERQARDVHRRAGRPTRWRRMDNTGVNGDYLT